MDLSVFDGLWSRFTDRPFNLEFAVTRNCNSRCYMCSQWKDETYDELSLQEIQWIFESYQNFKMIGITGGEPSLRKDLSEICETIIDYQPHLKRMFITSNGFLPEKLASDIEKIMGFIGEAKSPILTVLVSVDGNEQIHNRVRGQMFAHQKATESIRLLSKLRSSYPNLHLGSVSTYGPENFKEYDVVLEELRHLRSQFDLEPAFCLVWHGNLYRKNNGDNSLTYLDALRETWKTIVDFIEEDTTTLLNARAMFWNLSRYIAENPRQQVIPCEAAKIRYFLDSLGNVYPCIIWNEPILNLRENDYNFQQVFRSSKRPLLRKRIKRGKCPICYITCEFIPTMMAHPIKALWKRMN